MLCSHSFLWLHNMHESGETDLSDLCIFPKEENQSVLVNRNRKSSTRSWYNARGCPGTWESPEDTWSSRAIPRKKNSKQARSVLTKERRLTENDYRGISGQSWKIETLAETKKKFPKLQEFSRVQTNNFCKRRQSLKQVWLASCRT